MSLDQAVGDYFRARDRFGAPLLQEAEKALISCREDLEAFAISVYEAANHGSADP